MSVTKMRDADESNFLDALEEIIIGKDEKAEWEDEDMREAMKMLYRGKSYNEMEDEIGDRISRGQVSPQVDRLVSRLPEDDDDDGPGTEGDVVFQEPGPVAAEHFEEFLESVGGQVGMNEDFVSRMVYDVERLQQLPEPQSFGNAIDTSKSGVANGEQIRWCVDHYEDFLDKFAREASPHVVSSAVPQQYQQQNQQGGFGGQPTWGSGGAGAGGGAPQGGGFGGQQQTPQGGPQAGALAQVVETQKELMREIKEMKQDGGGGGGGLQDQVQQMAEVQQAINELQGGNQGGDDERTKMLINELRSLKQEMNSGGAQAQAGDPVKNALLRAAESGDQDLSKVVDVVERMESEDDPEVAVKKLEKEEKEMELKHQKEKTEKQMDAFQNIATTLASEVSDKIAEAASGGQQQAQPAQNQQAQQRPQQQAARQQRQQNQQAPSAGQQQQEPSASQQQEPSPQQGGDMDFEVTESAPDGGTTPDSTPPAVDDVQSQPQQPTGQPGEMPCPNCGNSIEPDPSTPGMECTSCDYSIQPCAECQNPIEILPPGDHETFLCPECDSATRPEQSEDEDLGCIDCDWEGGKDEAPSEGAVCGGCGSVYPVTRPGVDGGE